MPKGITKILFLALSFLLGVLLWVWWQGNLLNYSTKSAQIDSKVNDVLFACGVKDTDIVSQSRQEKNRRIYLWTESFKEVKLDAGVSIDAVKSKLKKLAQDNDLDYTSLELEKGTTSQVDREAVKLGLGDKIFSRLVFDIAAPVPVPIPRSKNRRVAIVIDDLGYKEDLSGFLSLGVPLTFAVLPREKYSRKIAQELDSKNIPFILHLPLEPEKYPLVNPGAYAILLKMTDSEIEKMYLKDIESVPGATGVSNHMGSAFSENEEKMKVLLTIIKKNGQFYFDSATTPTTKAPRAARAVGIKFAQSGMFLDIEDKPEYMDRQFTNLLGKVKKYGVYSAIGHYQRKYMIPMLKKYIPIFQKENIEFVYLNQIVQ
jgi:polysaccharide deacetylase 2 family uncharacterized protein YibQ